MEITQLNVVYSRHKQAIKVIQAEESTTGTMTFTEVNEAGSTTTTETIQSTKLTELTNDQLAIYTAALHYLIDDLNSRIMSKEETSYFVRKAFRDGVMGKQKVLLKEI